MLKLICDKCGNYMIIKGQDDINLRFDWQEKYNFKRFYKIHVWDHGMPYEILDMHFCDKCYKEITESLVPVMKVNKEVLEENVKVLLKKQGVL